MSKEKILMCWSGGKDSAMALYEILKSGHYNVAALLTTVTADYDRISMHGVRCSLLEQQAASLRIPLHKILISKACTNKEYEAQMEAALLHYKEKGIQTVGFGDIFLEDLRQYRDRNLAKIGMKGLYPIWKRDTQELALSFIGLGFRACLACVDPRVLNSSFVGREFEKALLRDLPASVDPCGENGEFHTFVHEGPLFHQKIYFELGEAVLRDGFWFRDLQPHTEFVS